MAKTLTIGDLTIGAGHPVYIIGEIGLNHNGDVNIAKDLIDAAAKAGCNAVKFQKRTPELCVPMDQREIKRDTPWGRMTYMNYRYKVEFGKEEYAQIAEHCEKAAIHWFASCWDTESVDFMADLDTLCFKVASAAVTDEALLKYINDKGKPIILSSGMSTMAEIKNAISLLDENRLALCHSTSAYPCPVEELNLKMIQTLQDQFDLPIGYSGHETGLATTVAAVALGATIIERHITLDRAMWGSDQAASIEPGGLERLVRDIRVLEEAMGDGVKKVYDSELPIIARLRK